MFELKEQKTVKNENGDLQILVTILKDAKEITGRHNIKAKVKQDDCDILTPEIKLSKSTEIKIANPKESIVNVYIQPENFDDIISLKVDTSDLNDVQEQHEEQIEDVEDTENAEIGNQDIIDDSDDSTDLNDTKIPESIKSTNKYPILKQTSQVEYDFIFTSQINEILSGNIKDNNTKEVYNKALNYQNKIVFFRDTNTSIYYWISHNKILSNVNPTNLLLEVNEYNRA